MNGQPKVSVIVPVYNTGKYLCRCLNSLVNQSLNELEIIVIDDGSTDNSYSIISDYAERYPEKFVVIRQENKGQAAARNKGLEVCRGEYIGFLDSDDYMDITYFQRMYDKAVSEQADYVACGYSDMTIKNDEYVELEHYVASKPAYVQKDMFFGVLVSPFIHIYRRGVIDESGVRFPEGFIYEDTSFYLDLIPYIKKLAVIEEPLAFRLRRSNSTTTSFQAKNVSQLFNALDETLKFYRNKNFWEEYSEELTCCCVRLLTCSSVRRISQVKGFKIRHELNVKTLDYLKKNFQGYRKNKYLKSGGQSLYIKLYSKYTADIITTLFRFIYRRYRSYT